MKKYNLAFLGSGAMGTEVIDYVISNLKDKFNIALITVSYTHLTLPTKA